MTAKDDALAALRTWREWRDRRDPLIWAARQAGATIAEIMAAGDCAKGTVTTALAHANPGERHVNTTEAGRRYHHPNFRSATTVTTGHGRRLAFTFSQFSPWGPEPVMPPYWADPALTPEDQEFLSQEWEAARIEHWRCVFREDVRRQLGDAGSRRNAYLAARNAMDDAYAAFATAGDGQWRSLLLAMATAHDNAMATAQDWDEAAHSLARAQRDHWRHAGRGDGLTLATVAAESGYGISEWDIPEFGLAEDPYQGTYPHYDGPAVAEVRPLVEQQQKLLKTTGEMAGEHSQACKH